MERAGYCVGIGDPSIGAPQVAFGSCSTADANVFHVVYIVDRHDSRVVANAFLDWRIHRFWVSP